MFKPGDPDKFTKQTEAGMEAIRGRQKQVEEAVKIAGYNEEVADRLISAFTWIAGEGMIDPYSKLDEALAPNIMALADQEPDTEKLAEKIKDVLTKREFSEAA